MNNVSARLNLVSIARQAVEAGRRALIRGLGGHPSQLDVTLSEIVHLNALDGMPEWADISKYEQQAKIYTQSPWVYIAVNKIAATLSQGKYQVKRQIGEKLIEQKNHPIDILLRRPNPWQSRFEFFETTYAFREIAGNAYWYLSGNETGKPTALYNLRPDRMRVVAGDNTDQMIAGYIYDVSGIQVPLEPNEVIHHRLFNPADDYYGLSRLSAAALGVMSDLAMERWNFQLFGKENAVPAGVVNVKEQVSDYDFDRIKREFLESYGGGKRKTAFVRAGEIDWQSMAVNQKDMDFIAGRGFTKEEIFLIFGIHPGQTDSNATEANAAVGDAGFIRDTIWPALVAFADKLTSDLAPFWGDDLIIEPEDIRVKNAQMEQAEIQAAGPYLTINEIREKYYSLPAVEWGDLPATGTAAAKPIAPGFGQPGMTIDTTATAASTDQADNPADTAHALDRAAENVVNAYLPRITTTKAVRRELATFVKFARSRLENNRSAIDGFEFEAVPVPVGLAVKSLVDVMDDPHDLDLITLLYEPDAKAIAPIADRVDVNGQRDPLASEKIDAAYQIQGAVARYLSGLRSRVLEGVRHINRTASSKTNLLDNLDAFLAYFSATWWQREHTLLNVTMRPIIQDVMEQAALSTYNMLKMSIGVGLDPHIFSVDAANFARDWTDKVLQDFGSTTENGAGAILQRWIGTPGATLEDLTAAIQESGLFSDVRAAMVGETESTRAFGQGMYSAANRMADAAGIKQRVSVAVFSRLLPAHVKCFCWVTNEFVYDENGKLIGMDQMWHTRNDDRVCAICFPRNGRLLSEIEAGGV